MTEITKREIVGNPFARVWETINGPLLVYTENLNPENAVLHQVMRLHSDVNSDRKIEGTPEQVLSAFMSYSLMDAEEAAILMIEDFERTTTEEILLWDLDAENLARDREVAHVRDSDRIDVV